MPNLPIHETKTETCDRCKNKFERKWTPNIKEYSRTNLISHWSDKEDNWKGWKLLCGSCLIEWNKDFRSEFNKLVPQNRSRTFRNYVNSGLIKERTE